METPSVTGSSTPLLEVFDDLLPPELHAETWAVCMSKNWFFGNRSTSDGPPFWKMELQNVDVIDRVWAVGKGLCEELTGTRLEVVRQYANGHTYGLGGLPHQDDVRPGTFTLLYYPMPEWKPEWDGETVYLDAEGEIAFTVRPRPNRAVVFDSRILHAGRAPSRACPELRVTVAFKLQSVS